MTARALASLPLLFAVGLTAAPRVNRCVSVEGTPIFTDRPCHMLEARPAQSPRASSPTPAEAQTSPEPAPGLCPAPDGESLREAVRRVFARKRVNDFAALYHWVGITRAGSVLIMDRLADLLRYPLAEVAFDPPFAESEWSVDDTRLPDLRLELRLSDREAETLPVWFRLRRYAGCLWISF